MYGGTDTEISPSPAGTTVTTTATVNPPVSLDTFDRVPIHITFYHSDGESWTREFKKGMRARLLLGLWDKFGPFYPVEGSTPDEILTAGRKAQAAYWYVMKSHSLSEVAGALSVQKATISVYSSQIRWTFQ